MIRGGMTYVDRCGGRRGGMTVGGVMVIGGGDDGGHDIVFFCGHQ